MCFKNHTSNLGRSASLYEIKSGRPSTLPSRCFTIKDSIHGSGRLSAVRIGRKLTSQDMWRMAAEPPDAKCVKGLHHIRTVIVFQGFPCLFADTERRFRNLKFDQKRHLPVYQRKYLRKRGMVSVVSCNRQRCSSFDGSTSTASGRPQIRDRSSS